VATLDKAAAATAVDKDVLCAWLTTPMAWTAAVLEVMPPKKLATGEPRFGPKFRNTS
jgi:hypothetical protein